MTDLSGHHRETIARIFAHPASGNVEWRRVLSLLRAVGATSEEPNGKVKVALGNEVEVLQRPREKDVDEQMIVDLRRLLTKAGLAPGSGDRS